MSLRKLLGRLETVLSSLVPQGGPKESEAQRIARIVSGRPAGPLGRASGLYAYYRTGAHKLGESGRQAIRDFAAANLAEVVGATETAYYPFGGPDVLYPTLFFPRMTKLILVGTEHVGELPRGDVWTLSSQKEDVLRMVSTLLDLSFYRNKEMAVDQTSAGLATLTKIVASLSVLDANITSVRAVTVDPGGSVVPFVRGRQGERAPAAEVRYTLPSSPAERSVYYFQQNLADREYQGLAPLQSSPGFIRFIEGLPGFTGFHKASSYLPHSPALARSTELSMRADFILQTDTGIPYRAFESEAWDLRFFGGYDHPLPYDDFKHGAQPDLKAALASGALKSRGELPFWYDYGSPDVCNIMYAIRRKG